MINLRSRKSWTKKVARLWNYLNSMYRTDIHWKIYSRRRQKYPLFFSYVNSIVFIGLRNYIFEKRKFTCIFIDFCSYYFKLLFWVISRTYKWQTTTYNFLVNNKLGNYAKFIPTCSKKKFAAIQLKIIIQMYVTEKFLKIIQKPFDTKSWWRTKKYKFKKRSEWNRNQWIDLLHCKLNQLKGVATIRIQAPTTKASTSAKKNDEILRIYLWEQNTTADVCTSLAKLTIKRKISRKFKWIWISLDWR